MVLHWFFYRITECHFTVAAVVLSFYNRHLPLLLGSITMEEILTVLPFGGTFDLVKIKGSTVKRAFEHCVHRYGSMSGEFLQVSGLCSSPCAAPQSQFHPESPRVLLTVTLSDEVLY